MLIKHLPRILKFLEMLQRRADEGAIEKKIEHDFDEIERAFNEGDEDALRALFNNELRDQAKTNNF